jgi:hypothetical protein
MATKKKEPKPGTAAFGARSAERWKRLKAKGPPPKRKPPVKKKKPASDIPEEVKGMRTGYLKKKKKK